MIAAAPVLLDHLCDPCREHFVSVRADLESVAIPYQLNPRLVRGLDYYTRTVFEIMPEEGGSTATIAAGGRYDGLIEILGGRPTPGIGYASGIERIVLNLKKQEVPVPPAGRIETFVLHQAERPELQQRVERTAVELSSRLRRGGVATLQSYGERSLKAQMRQAGRANARYAVIIDDEGVESGALLLRDLESHAQERHTEAEMVERLARASGGVEGI